MSTDIIENIIYDPNVPCTLKCNEDLTDCDIDCQTITTTSPPPISPVTTVSPPGNNLWDTLTDTIASNTDVITGTVVVGGVTYVAIEYVYPILENLMQRPVTTVPPTTTTTPATTTSISPQVFDYIECKVGSNSQRFTITNPSSFDVNNYRISLSEDTVECSTCGSIDLTQFQQSTDAIFMTLNLDIITSMTAPTVRIVDLGCNSVDQSCSFSLPIQYSGQDACNESAVINQFQQAVSSSYVEKYWNFDQVKLSFTARTQPGVTLSEAIRTINNACYDQPNDPTLISCKVINANEFDETNGVMRRSGKEDKPDQNKRQGTTSATIVQVDVQATYSERKNETVKQAIMDNVVDNVEDNDNVFSDISQFISIDDNKEAFIFQMTVLCLSIVIGFGGAISRILHFRRNKTKQNEKNAKRNLAQDYNLTSSLVQTHWACIECIQCNKDNIFRIFISNIRNISSRADLV